MQKTGCEASKPSSLWNTSVQQDSNQLWHWHTLLFPIPAFQWSQNAWPWTTLTGYFALNCFRAGLAGWDRATSESNCVKINKDRHILSAVQIFSRDSSFWQCKVCADIRCATSYRSSIVTVVLSCRVSEILHVSCRDTTCISEILYMFPEKSDPTAIPPEF